MNVCVNSLRLSWMSVLPNLQFSIQDLLTQAYVTIRLLIVMSNGIVQDFSEQVNRIFTINTNNCTRSHIESIFKK